MGLETKLVIEDQTHVSNGTDFEYLAVDSLRTCLALAVYDESQQISGVTHVRFPKDLDREGGFVSNELYEYQRNFWKAYGFANELIEQADKLGGGRYILFVFNLESEDRTPDENRQLKKVVNVIVTNLRKSRKIIDVKYRKEQAFRLSTSNGDILPYS